MTGTTFRDTNVQVGQRYYYVLAAIDQVGNVGAYSNEATTVPLGDRTAPVISAMNPADGSRTATVVNLSVSVTDNVGVTSFVFEYSTDGHTWLPIVNSAASAYAWDVTTLPTNNYQVRVTVSDAAGNSATATRTYVVDHDAPAAPANPRASAAQLALVVAWDSVVASDFRSYGLYKSVDGGPITLVLTTSSTVYIDSAVQLGSSYTYQVRASDDLGNQSAGATTTAASPLADTTAPVMKTISPADGTTTKGILNIQAAASDNVRVASFQFYFRLAGTLTWTAFGTDSTPALSGWSWTGQCNWNTAGLDEAGYTIRVVAVDADGNTSEMLRS